MTGPLGSSIRLPQAAHSRTSMPESRCRLKGGRSQLVLLPWTSSGNTPSCQCVSPLRFVPCHWGVGLV